MGRGRTRSFRVEPSSWTTTILSETLQVEGQPYETWLITIAKWLPNLWIDSAYDPEIYVGRVGMFTLLYSNTGGYENDVWIENLFPPQARFASSNPPADDASLDRLRPAPLPAPRHQELTTGTNQSRRTPSGGSSRGISPPWGGLRGGAVQNPFDSPPSLGYNAAIHSSRDFQSRRDLTEVFYP